MRRRIGIIFFGVGLILIAITFKPIFLMVRETVLDSNVNSKYEIKQIIDIRNEIGSGAKIKARHD